ncbi:draxin isoform X1 [Rana temporaria]|uniref:draxin isoform X1 n=1 Tax=Rana temporaria TaxID=8407 RepID=UPI001AAC86B8|nr:draxin isoform X1 [Rana temporaria]XP_040182015.1 draxin isoform X1 [Rana temporaria]
MVSFYSCLLLLVLITNALMGASALEPRAKRRRVSDKYDEDVWLHQHHDRPQRRSGLAKKERTHGGEEGRGSFLQVGDNGQFGTLKQDRLQSFELPYSQRENQPPGTHTKGRKHKTQRRSNQKERLKHHKARAFEAEPSGLLKEDLSLREPTHSTHVEMSSSASSATRHPSSTAEPMFINEQPTAMVEAPRRAKSGKKGGEVMPTLDMTLFDWTDYEDLKPDTWPSPKKGKQREKLNATAVVEEEPCDHHLDCLPGSCCDLREHLCKPHNRGLNNKCYDDCMCTEGLRCFSKFHRNQRVTRKKGRCVDPESINKDQGSFISV